MEKVSRFGQMGPCMKDGGLIAKQTDKEGLSMLMVMSMMVNGFKIKLMDLVSTAILTEQDMKGIGKKINSMVMDLRHGQMVQDMKVNMLMDKSKDLVVSHGQMVAHSMVSLLKIIFKVMDSITGLMEESLMDHGQTTKWKGEVSSLGPTVVDMMVNTWMTRKRVTESFIGQMEENMMAAGKMENNMESVSTHQVVVKQNKVNGLKVREYNGSKRSEQRNIIIIISNYIFVKEFYS